MKKKVLIIFVILVVLVGAILWCFKSNQSYYITDYEWLYDEAIKYLETEIGEESEYKLEDDYQVFTDYKGFGIQENGTQKYAYMWILEEEYYVQNGKVQNGSGSSMAYKFTFENNKVIDYEIPKDGSYYTSSIKKMFPSEVVDKIFKFNMDSSNLDKKVKKHYEYLETVDSSDSETNLSNSKAPEGEVVFKNFKIKNNEPKINLDDWKENDLWYKKVTDYSEYKKLMDNYSDLRKLTESDFENYFAIIVLSNENQLNYKYLTYDNDVLNIEMRYEEKNSTEIRYSGLVVIMDKSKLEYEIDLKISD